MKKMYSAIAIAVFLGVSTTPLYADMDGMHGMKDQPMGEMKDQMQNTHRGQGTVNGVDTKAGKVNLSHGPIASLNWPAMTMGFPVKDAAMLDGIQPGMKVDFELEQAGGGYRIVSIKPSN